MKTISFIRHAKLEKPYDNYDRLSFDQLESLAAQTVMPSINQRAVLDEAAERDLQLQKATVILCADSIRAKQTAAMIQKYLPDPVRVLVTPLLNEVAFSPKALVAQAEYDQYGMQIIRDKLFAAIVRRTAGAEPLDALYARVAALEKKLETLPDESILCVTHGFYMRFLELYFNKPAYKYDEVNEAVLAQQPNHPNLQGFVSLI